MNHRRKNSGNTEEKSERNVKENIMKLINKNKTMTGMIWLPWWVSVVLVHLKSEKKYKYFEILSYGSPKITLFIRTLNFNSFFLSFILFLVLPPSFEWSSNFKLSILEMIEISWSYFGTLSTCTCFFNAFLSEDLWNKNHRIQ